LTPLDDDDDEDDGNEEDDEEVESDADAAPDADCLDLDLEEDLEDLDLDLTPPLVDAFFADDFVPNEGAEGSFSFPLPPPAGRSGNASGPEGSDVPPSASSEPTCGAAAPGGPIGG